MKVLAVDRGSDAERAGLRPGDELVAIDDQPVGDGIDIAHAVGWSDEETVTLRFAREGSPREVVLPTLRPEELGLTLEPDAVRTCGNRCVFCFIDQLPRGLRSSLYLKDGDYRLSFTCGNYVTLTNLTEADYRRVLDQRLSPLYVSVHTTDDAIRRRLLGNPDAPAILESLRRLTDGGIRVHTQIVICPGINDGEVFERTLSDLASLGDGLASVAVVPVGLTEHRAGLPELAAVGASEALDIVRAVERWGGGALSESGRPKVFAADELYLVAGLDVPAYDAYGEFPQLENGVGMLRWFEQELRESARRLRCVDAGGTRVAVITGTLAARFIGDALDDALRKTEGLTITVVPVVNRFLGETVTVAGLLAGNDIVETLKANGPESPADADLILLPAEAFNTDGLTLDGLTLDEIRTSTDRDQIEAASDIVASIEEHLRRRGTRLAEPPRTGHTTNEHLEG